MLTRLDVFRIMHPKSRAIRDYTVYGSSSVVRRAYCIYCGVLIDTCSAKWPATKTWYTNIQKHHCEELDYYEECASLVDSLYKFKDRDFLISKLPKLFAKLEQVELNLLVENM